MFEIRVPIEEVKRLSPEDRYAYYLLGHMFNELMALQKQISFLLPKHGDVRRSRRSPEIGQAVFMFRIASSKVWEAKEKLWSKEISKFLRERVFPEMADGSSQLKELNAAINSASWLASLRNVLGFHYPSFEDWRQFTTPDEDWVDDIVYVGEANGNTFYDGSEAVAQYWMFSRHGRFDVPASIDPLIEQMITLLTSMTNFLSSVISTFIGVVLLGGHGKHISVGKVLAPQHDEFFVPFWTSMEQGKLNR